MSFSWLRCKCSKPTPVPATPAPLSAEAKLALSRRLAALHREACHQAGALPEYEADVLLLAFNAVAGPGHRLAAVNGWLEQA